MNDKVIKLNADEMVVLNNLFHKSKRDVKRNSIVAAIGAVIFSLIPVGIWHSTNRETGEDYNQNMIQSLGLGWWLVTIILGIGVYAFFAIRTKKISQLKKDLAEGEKLEVDVVVTGKNSDTRYDYYYMRVSSDTLKNKKIILSEGQFSQYEKGQKLTIDVYKNSMILISNRI